MVIEFWARERKGWKSRELAEKMKNQEIQARWGKKKKKEAFSDCLGDQSSLLLLHLRPDVDQSQLKHNTPSLTH